MIRCAWILAAAGCSGAPTTPTTDPCQGDASATLEVGTGEGSFEALEEGDDLTFHAGPQGGHHVFVSLITTGLLPGTGNLQEPDDPAVTVELTAQGAMVSQFQDRQRLFTASDRGDELVGQIVVLSHPDPPKLEGANAELSVWVTDRCGTTVQDGRSVILTEGAPDPTL